MSESYAACRREVALAGSSFAAGMRLFPSTRRDAVYAIYAFFRRTDDIVDDDAPVADKITRLAAWADDVSAALAGEPSDGCLPALADTVQRYRLPERLLTDCIEACRTDCGTVRMADWAELLRYCDGVAGTVGEACLRILGYYDDDILELSHHNARAIQLTNILRDVDEDWAWDRVYLPTAILDEHQVTCNAIAECPWPTALLTVLGDVANQAEQCYRQAEPMFELLRPADRPALVAMTLRYRWLLSHLQQTRFQAEPSARPRRQLWRLLAASQASRWAPTWRG